MDRPIKLWEYLAGLIAFIIAIVTTGYNIGNVQGKIIQTQVQAENRVDKMEIRVDKIENFLQGYPDYLDAKLDPMRKDLTDIKIMIIQTKNEHRK